MANRDMCLKAAQKAFPHDEKMRVAYMLGFNEGYDRANEQSSLQQEQQEGDLKEYILNKLHELGADLIHHKPYSFNRGLNVGKTNAYHDILDRLTVRKEE